jgi:serine protease Do
VGHSDRAWDLALLVPQNGRWQKGLRASTLSATHAGLALRMYSHVGPQSLALSRTVLRGVTTLVGGDSELLPDALELASNVKPTDLGGPVLDEQGNVLAVIGRACAQGSAASCRPTAFGIPVSAVRAFLRTVPEHALPPAPWLGIRGVADEVGPVKGVRVLSVHPESAAAAAALRGDPNRERSDVVVAVDGVPVPTPELLADTINKRAVGDSVDLLLFGGGRFREVSLSLRPAPGNTPPKKSKGPPGTSGKPR